MEEIPTVYAEHMTKLVDQALEAITANERTRALLIANGLATNEDFDRVERELWR
jgi:hypothetical protein